MNAHSIFIGINTTPRYQTRECFCGGNKTGPLTTRPEAIFGHRLSNATAIIEFYETEATSTVQRQ